MTDDSWNRILAAVLEQREADVASIADTPLEFGQPIAWATKLLGRTDGFTPVHRVGFPVHGEPYTACGELIHGPYGWLQLSSRMLRTMDHCVHCNAEIGRVMRQRAA